MSSQPEAPVWSRRRAIAGLGVAIGATGLSACGFSPLYGGGGPARAAELARIEVAPIADRPGQMLRRMLVQAMYPDGRPRDPAYILVTALEFREADILIQDDDTVTRKQVTLVTAIRLDRAETGDTVLSQAFSVVTAFNVVLDLVATRSNRQDAVERALRLSSEEILLRLSLFLERTGRA